MITCYFIANSTGTRKINNIGAGGRTTAVSFPIGASNSSYTPISLTNTGTPDQFSARAAIGVNSAYDAGDVPNGSGQTSLNVDRTWFVSEATPGGSNVTLTFQWNGVDEQPGFNRLACFASHYYSGAWHPGSMGSAAGSNPYTTSLSNITSFSPFGVGSGGILLPLTLLSFTGQSGVTGNVLSWTITNEVNVASFAIERGADGIHFSSAGTVNVQTSNAVDQQSYQYTDTYPADEAFYRLKIFDRDGACYYSAILKINNTDNGAGATYHIYPNPATGSVLYIKPPAAVTENVAVRVIDATGKKWYSDKIDASILNSGKATIHINTLPAGIYILQIRNEKTGAVSLLKFEK